MKKVICPLNIPAERKGFLEALQKRFAEACNTTAELARKHHCTARVALHHLAYHTLRQQFPDLGAQLACNAIYTVARLFKQLNLPRSAPLPRLHFTATAPVFFDQRTLTLKDRQVSLFTLDGRLRFELDIPTQVIQLLQTEEIKEIVLFQQQGHYALAFFLQAKPAVLPACIQTDSTRQHITIHTDTPCIAPQAQETASS